jgi:DNA uptake protein ComE-like DNA-binding protein
MLNEVLNLPAVQEVQRENFSIANVRNDLIEAGDKTKRSTNSLLEQLRKYLEHKSFNENKRIYDNIQEALKIISLNADKDFNRLDLLEVDNVIDIDLILGHGWEIRGFKPPEKIKFVNNNPEEGKSISEKDQLYEQFEISVADLKNNIKCALKNKTHITFSDFVKEFEIKKGVAEIVAYVEIASNEKSRHIVKDDAHDFISIRNSKTNKNFKVKIPQIVFCK